jgi:hypothetical protein
MFLPWPPWATWQEKETILSVSHNPRWPRQSTMVCVACRCCQHYRDKLCQCKHGLRRGLIVIAMYIGKVCMQKHQWQQHMTVTTVLALANGNDPMCVVLPKVAKASTVVTIACICRWHFHCKNFTNETQLYWRGRLQLTSLKQICSDHSLFYTVFFCFTKQAILTRRSNVLGIPLQ